LWEQTLKNDPTYEPARAALAKLNISAIALIVGKRAAFIVGIIAILSLSAIGLLATFAHFQHAEPKSLATSATESQVVLRKSSLKVPLQTGSTETPDSSSQALSVIAHELSNSIAERLQRIQDEQSRPLTAEIKLIHTNQTVILKNQNDAERQLIKLSQSLEALAEQQRDAQRVVEQSQRDIRAWSIAHEQAMQVLSNSLPAASRATRLDFQVTGITMISQPDDWILRFDAGIFDRDDHFKIGSKTLLQSAAKALVQTQEKLRIEVVGFADNEVATWPWSKPLSETELGLVRGEKIQRFLESLQIFPPNAVRVVGGSSEERPFPSESKKNRTVVLRIYRE
jgi:hypothetical protein